MRTGEKFDKAWKYATETGPLLTVGQQDILKALLRFLDMYTADEDCRFGEKSLNGLKKHIASYYEDQRLRNISAAADYRVTNISKLLDSCSDITDIQFFRDTDASAVLEQLLDISTEYGTAYLRDVLDIIGLDGVRLVSPKVYPHDSLMSAKILELKNGNWIICPIFV